MGLSIGKVRVGLLVSAALLVAVVFGFVWYAHTAARRFVKGLPGRLGIDVKQTTDNFTYSQSLKGKTVFTIHAAKAIQHSDGKVTLRDVGIVLYGREGNRADRIYGDEFQYDQNAGIVRATGDVRIDLQAPAAAFHGKPDGGVHEALPGHGETGSSDARVIHVRTRGLVFDKNKGQASTSEQVDFTSGGMAGRAVGAQYDSNTGVLVLDAAVHVSGLMKDRPGVLTAAHAELDRAGNTAVFTGARYVSPGQGVEADHAVVHTTKDGTPQAMEARGHVRLTGDDRGAVLSDRMDMVLNAKGKPESSHLYGGVRYVDETAGQASHGSADDARIAFDGDGRATRMEMNGGVAGEERGPTGTRSLSAARLVLALQSAGSHSVVRDAEATGGARLREAGVALAGKNGVATTDMMGDRLQAHFDAVNGLSRVSTVHGAGHTVLHQVAENGIEQTSSGETLEMAFRPAATRAKQKTASAEQAVEIERAVQRGGVTVVRTVPTRAGIVAQVQRASAEEETYDGDSDRVTLKGRAQVEDPTASIYADTVTLERASGDAAAEGGVRTTYLQAGARDSAKNEPTHVLADHATFQHDLGTAYFFGTVAKPARLWQGSSQVEAPVLEFYQTEKKLIARGDGAGDAAVVHGVLLGSAAKPVGNAGARQTVVHVSGQQMVYSDGARTAELKGKVRVEDADGVMTSDQATVYLASAAANVGMGSSNKVASNAGPSAFLGGQVDRMVAVGMVKVVQPGRRAEGQQLVYTAEDRTFVLTGTKAAPPRVVSDGRDNGTPGTVVGSSLRFRSGDDGVLVSGGDGQSGLQRVKTETRVKK